MDVFWIEDVRCRIATGIGLIQDRIRFTPSNIERTVIIILKLYTVSVGNC